MMLRYSGCVTLRQTPPPKSRADEAPDIPNIWLLSDERNDAVLEAALAKLPRGSGFIFRHYHLEASSRRARFEVLAALARKRDHRVILSGSGVLALKWGADGIYGPPERMRRADGLLRLATAHSLPEIRAAERAGADAVLFSPVFPTRSHENTRTLGPVRFRLIAIKARIPVIALGGMNAARANQLGWPRWAAIDGLAPSAPGP